MPTPLFETLHHAAASPDDALAPVVALLASHHNVNATDKEGRTPLHLAARYDNPKILELLIEHGADVNASMPRGFTALHYAARHARLEVTQTLIAHGADANAAMDHGLSVAHLSAEDGRLDIFKYLVEHGADPHAMMVNGVTLLHAATRQGRLEIVQYLVEEHGLDVNIPTKAGATALHDAAAEKQLPVLEYLLDKGADITAIDKQRRSPLHRAIWGGSRTCAHVYPIVRTLCGRGALWDKGCEQEMARTVKIMTKPPKADGSERRVEPRSLWRTGIYACIVHWQQQRQDDPTAELQEIPVESILRGSEAVATYLANIHASAANELVLRRKICVVGPSKWGKTSLVKSLTSLEPSLVHIDDRTIGIDLFAHSFVEEGRDGKPSKRHEVTFWDFAGQDEYQVAHAMFFSKRTLYLLCVDLEQYDLVWQETEKSREGEHAMARFLRANVFRWVRAIVSRQADAEFVVVGTKLDKVASQGHANRLWTDLSCRLGEWMKTFADEIAHELAQVGGRLSGEAGGDTESDNAHEDDRLHFQSLQTTLKHLFTKDWLVVSSASVDSIVQARETLEKKITSSTGRSFLMPIKYSRVLDAIRRRREQAVEMTNAERIANLIVPVRALCSVLMREIEDLEGEECREILQTLHDLGDVLWYEHEASGALKGTVILDPTLVLDFVREIVTHEYAANTADEPTAYVEEGRLTHELVQSRPLWRDLDDELTFAFKQLLQFFQLAYPADNAEMDWDSDLIIPTYWKVGKQRDELRKSQRRLDRQASMVKRHGIDNVASRFCWEYELSAEVSETVFEHFAVQSYSSTIKRHVRPKCIEAFVQDDCAALITLSPGELSRDVIRLEAAVADVHGGWQYLRYYVMALETVLDGYPGLLVSRFVIDADAAADNETANNRHRLSRALNMLEDARWMGKDDSAVRLKMPWLPRDIDWFIEKAWRTPGALQQLRTQEIVRETVNKLDVLKKLVVASDAQRRFPALWTLEVDSLDSTKPVVRVRMLSDLSGDCFHDPIEIQAPSSFFAKHGKLLQAGMFILSNVVPEIVSLGIVQKAIEALSPVVDNQVARATTLYNLIDQFDLSPAGPGRVVVAPASSQRLSPRGAVALLRDLLTLYDDAFDELRISDIAKLQCAATSDGHYVWANRQEIMTLGDQLTPCDPQDVHTDLKRTLSSTSTASTVSASSSSNNSDSSQRVRLSVTGIVGLAAWDWRKTYCHWQIVHATLGLLGSGSTPQHTEYSQPPSWDALEFKLPKVKSLESLRECSLRVSVKRPSRCLGVVKLLAETAVPLEDAVSTDEGLAVLLPLDTSDPPARFVTITFTS